MTVVAIIVAGGAGLRVGNELPKQYIKIAGKSILQCSIDAFINHPLVDYVQVVIGDSHKKFYDESVILHHKLLPCCVGGKERQDSVFSGLNAIKHLKPSKVLIHDAARPFINDDTITSVIDALDSYDAVDLGADIVDTLRDRKDISLSTNRDDVYGVQTPQGFKFHQIYHAHEEMVGAKMPDDISIALKAGLDIAVMPGDRRNFKITTKEDVTMATNLLMSEYETRIGQGFDVHKVEPSENAEIHIGGVAIPSKYKIVAHSDGDVALHALMDSLLGALSLGDIGVHFPPTDMKYKDVDSKELLRHVKNLLDEKGAIISNIDMTILCEAPKIMPHKDKIINCIAEILNLDKDRVSIKATTTEKLGFIGRGEGIAAQAVSLLRVKI